MPVDGSRGSFGSRRERTEDKPRVEQQQPVPVLHVGEVHAELRLHITDETLSDLGSQIGSLIATAIRQGMEAGFAAGMAAIEADDKPGDPSFRPGVMPCVNPHEDPEGVLTAEDLRRARGQ